ncbi:hypothetical protein Sjap_019395 [Stephania japonica]|uniref:Uncharacterized protein n=1 Tax=Stephania japonica TaxID=461633 RepID=A0AAP0EYQ8_9MAGN
MASITSYQYHHREHRHKRSRRRSCGGLGKRCLSMVKQQKTRFYILGRWNLKRQSIRGGNSSECYESMIAKSMEDPPEQSETENVEGVM